MKDLFNLVTIVDGQKDSAAIVEIFQKIYDGKLRNDLKLLNFLREMPVSFGATLDGVSEDSVDLTVHQNQAVMMKQDKFTLIRSSHFPHGYGVHAYVAAANPSKCMAILVRFAFAQIKADRRNAIRIQIHQDMPATFVGPTGTTSGNMLDISVGGISIKVTGKVEAELEETGKISCTLPTGPLNVSAKLLKIVNSDDECRAIFTIEPDARMEPIISQFIFNEQIGIIKDLKEGIV
ncbi:MAG TPA: PilZ domain-containing protein [Desulfuromonadaceae bacterium]|jgi:hypothetical protein